MTLHSIISHIFVIHIVIYHYWCFNHGFAQSSDPTFLLRIIICLHIKCSSFHFKFLNNDERVRIYKSIRLIYFLFNWLDSAARIHGNDLCRVLVYFLIFIAQNVSFCQYKPSPIHIQTHFLTFSNPSSTCSALASTPP